MPKTASIDRPPWLEVLEGARTVLVAGCGGGFDLYSGLPIVLWLESRGKTAVLANLTFTNIRAIEAPWIVPGLKRVEASTPGMLPYFPERHLCQWFANRGEERAVYCFEMGGVRPLAAAYEHLVAEHRVDAVVLADGGTDSLMRGDEPGLGTPHEDMLSIAAVHRLPEVPVKILTCAGFGVDAYHGVCHAHVLESIAALACDGGFLGSLSLLGEMPEVAAYVEAVDHACRMSDRKPSIVNTSIASAIEGRYGNHHRAPLGGGVKLWINPLMSQMWFFDLGRVAARVLYLEYLRDTESFPQVARIIEGFHKGARKRPWRQMPI